MTKNAPVPPKLYPYFELVRIVTTPRKSKGRDISDRIDYVPEAVFTDEELLKAYSTAAAFADGSVIVRKEFTDKEPVAAMFKLPFNPIFKKPETAA